MLADVEQLIYREARYQDEHAYDEWEALWTDDGVYWVPLFELLERRGLQVYLVDPRQTRHAPGRPKSDVLDCQWIQRLMALGLLRAAVRPDAEVCVVRAVVRQRDLLTIEQGRWVQRMQKSLVQMNIQLT